MLTHNRKYSIIVVIYELLIFRSPLSIMNKSIPITIGCIHASKLDNTNKLI